MVTRLLASCLALMLVLTSATLAVANDKKTLFVNVLLTSDVTDSELAQLSNYGTVDSVVDQLDAVSMTTKSGLLDDIRGLSFVLAANPDAERLGAPIDTVEVADFSNGINTWNLDAVNVTDFGAGRQISADGSGVYVAVLDTGLMDSWRQYFPEERIAEEYAIAFGGGGGERGAISTQPNKWEQDTHGHGTHVTSSVIGYSLGGTPVNGVAPMATIIPVKVLNQNGSGWSSVVAAGITYIADLKAGPLAGSPVVINMSLGGPVLDVVEKAAIDYAIAQGVIVVASAGNEGEAGMGYPGAYEPVISAAASGWTGEWLNAAGTFDATWWFSQDVADPTDADDFYITDFSSRALEGQDLDVAAPGSWVVGPFQLQQGKTSYFFLGGTSMAAPHVAGIAALMAQTSPGLTGPEVEDILESTAIPLDAGCRQIFDPNIGPTEVCWGTDATGHGLTTADAALGIGGGAEATTKPGKGRGGR